MERLESSPLFVLRKLKKSGEGSRRSISSRADQYNHLITSGFGVGLGSTLIGGRVGVIGLDGLSPFGVSSRFGLLGPIGTPMFIGSLPPFGSLMEPPFGDL